MNTRSFGSTPVGEIGLGCWQIGGDQWGDVAEPAALDTLHAAADAGTTFFDTADVYGSGRSEELVGRFLKDMPRGAFVATKLGRLGPAGLEANCTPAAMTAFTDASLKRLGVDALDLTQLHCVPQAILERGEVFETLRKLQAAGKIRRFGASVESTAEAKVCLAQPGLASLQIIFNVFRQTPIAAIFDECRAKGVAVIVRLPLASGLLAGKYRPETAFAANDHRSFNRNGERFNVGETFAGLGFERGLEVVEKLRPMVPAGYTMAQFALKWCLSFDAVTVVIPGARDAEQARANAAVSDLPPLPAELLRRLAGFYRDEVVPLVRGPD